jgi:pyridoxine 4-dehydrogenase
MTDMSKLGGKFTFPGTRLTVNRMGFGAMQLPGKGVWGPPRNHAAALAVLRAAIAAGIDHVDTADFYGPEVSNELIADALTPYPAGLTIVTKVGAKRGDDASWLAHKGDADLAGAIERNLATLGLATMDIVNLRLFEDDESASEIERMMKALIGLQDRGLIRHLGISNAGADQVAVARSLAPIVCVQNHYNLAHRKDDALIDALAADGIAYVPYFPLGGFAPIQSDRLDRTAAKAGATPMQLALAWLLQRAPNILVIPGTSSLTHLHENIAAADLVLDDSALAEIDAIAG